MFNHEMGSDVSSGWSNGEDSSAFIVVKVDGPPSVSVEKAPSLSTSVSRSMTRR